MTGFLKYVDRVRLHSHAYEKKFVGKDKTHFSDLLHLNRVSLMTSDYRNTFKKKTFESETSTVYNLAVYRK